MANPASPPDTPSHQSLAALERTAPCSPCHTGPDADELSKMLSRLGSGSRDELTDAAGPPAGLRVVSVRCDDKGDIDLEDPASEAAQHRDRLAAIMVTSPSTHGVHEAGSTELCEIVHEAGGQEYIDVAHRNALLGLARPGEFGDGLGHLS
ncbi:hypothetical protein [Streptomyces platensis]|uniref:hypothetical protein n=1 Tax=Streptomyces platensis TaxID=58346 RepID=UPI0036AA16AA